MSSPTAIAALTDRQHVLYRMYDDANALLYVGITADPGARFTNHERNQDWWPDVATIALEHLPNRPAALAAERRAILDEHPRYNWMLNRSLVPIEERHKPTRSIRMEDDIWDELGEVYGTRSRSALLEQVSAWLLRRPGAKLPERKTGES